MPCAYCESSGSMTREHVIPRFLYNVGADRNAKGYYWTLAAMKRVGGDFVVRDVCGECNSGPLSRLDAYGKSFLQPTGILVENYPRSTVALRYNYALLLRWLLKLTFNSSRSVDGDPYNLSLFRHHILDGREPLPAHVAMVACLLRGEAIDKLDLKKHEHLKGIHSLDGKWRPFFVRTSFLLLPEEFSSVNVRVCSFGCLSLFLVIDLAHQPKGFFRQYVKGVMAFWPNASELIPQRDRLVLKESRRTWGQEFLPMLEIEEAVDAEREAAVSTL